jgi:hypothetical protein
MSSPSPSFFDQTDNPPSARQQRFGALGLGVAAAGAVLSIIALTAVDWFTHTGTDGPSKVSHINSALKQADVLHAASGLSKAYFGWLAWALLIVGVLCAVTASVPSSIVPAARVAGAAVGLAAAVLTFIAIKFLTTSEPGYTEYLKHARLGFYLAVVGFVLIGVGSGIGAHRANR